MEQFDADYRRQLHFNFSATRTTQKQKQASDATRASRLRDVDLDALPDNTSSTISSSKRQDLSRYILEDILDCPVGSRFIVCIATEDNDDKRSKYYSETARAIQSDFRSEGLPVETWRMSSKRYLVLQGRITRSSHYDDISMKSLTQRQFRDAFSNESGDVVIQFDGITTRLTVPWRDFMHLPWFAPRWKVLGQCQCKYLGAYHEQLDCLLRDHQYSRLEEVRRNRCVRTYHGRTGKMAVAVAHDEWLELNNKEFAMYPSVRTLDGMMRQGQFIGLTQKAKRVIETIYSPGAISDRIVHHSGTGSKGNCSPEKEFIGKVIGLFLGNPFDKNNRGRVLEQGFMMSLHGQITTKLDRKRLDRETTFIQHEDSAGILLNVNGVNMSDQRELIPESQLNMCL